MKPAREQIRELPPSIHLLYAQLLEQAGNPLPATNDTIFLPRVIDGKTYWIQRVQVGSTRMELSLGRETDKLLEAIEKTKLKRKAAEEEAESRENLVKMLISGNANSIDPLSGRILSLMEGAGIFAAGGILVGSHAFNVYGNMFGYKLPLETARTADIDLSISIGVSKEVTDLKTAVLESDLGFFEVPALDRKSPSTSYKIRGKEIQVDILTPLRGPQTSKPVYMNALKSYASPVRSLDYLLKDPVKAVAVTGRGVLVNVPQPSRFAIHKLVLSQRRKVSEQLKSIKDLNQASFLLEILLQDRPMDLYPALIDVKQSKSRKYEKQMLQGLEQISNRELLPDKTINIFNIKWGEISKESDIQTCSGR